MNLYEKTNANQKLNEEIKKFQNMINEKENKINEEKK